MGPVKNLALGLYSSVLDLMLIAAWNNTALFSQYLIGSESHPHNSSTMTIKKICVVGHL